MDKNPSIFRKLVNRGDNLFDKEIDPCNSPIGSSRYLCASGTTSGTDSEEYIRDHASILSLQPWIFKREKENPNFNEKAEASSIYKTSFRTKRGHRNSIKPISIENCLIPQLYNEDFKIEDHVFSSIKTRPFIVTDGIRVINNNSECEISSLRVKKIEEMKKGKRKSLDLVDNVHSRSNKHSNSRALSPSARGESSNNKSDDNKVFLVSIGICIGVVYTILSNKKEVEKLNDDLRRTANLVQDLQEELEMKDSLTVKELLPLEQEQKPSRSILREQDGGQSMSIIEAELEAELERLELNITSSSIRGRHSYEEVDDEELEGEMVKGEFRAETLNKRDDYDNDDDYYDISGAKSDHWTGPVSPRQLSIRLHELLQQRQEERIKELETALAQSQRQIQLLETTEPSVFSERTLSNSDLDSGPLNEPFCLDLSGDALNAYDEAFEEFNRMNGEDDEKEKVDKVCNVDWGMELGDNNDDYDDDSDDDNDDCDEIIQKLVEKTKQGSPVVRHAQMILLSLDDLTLIG